MSSYIFIQVVMQLYSKMLSPAGREVSAYQYTHFFWIRSTLILMPLFGVQFAFFLAIHYLVYNTYSSAEAWWLFADDFTSAISVSRGMSLRKPFHLFTFLNVFKGAIVAYLFCFWNHEVRTELRRFYQKRFGSESPVSRNTCHTTSGTANSVFHRRIISSNGNSNLLCFSADLSSESAEKKQQKLEEELKKMNNSTNKKQLSVSGYGSNDELSSFDVEQATVNPPQFASDRSLSTGDAANCARSSKHTTTPTAETNAVVMMGLDDLHKLDEKLRQVDVTYNPHTLQIDLNCFPIGSGTLSQLKDDRLQQW